MKKHIAFRIIVLILISGFLGYFLGVNKVALDWKNYRPSIHIVSKEPPSRLSNVDFSLFWTVWQKLESSYYDKTKIDPQKMLNGAIDGVVGSLGDPFTLYLPPKQNTNFKEGLAGQFSGIGAELGMKEKQIIVIAPLDDSPAKKQGIKAGDAILKVDASSTSGWSLAQAVEKIRGPKGTKVILTVLHKDQKEPMDVSVVRDVITVKSVDGSIKNIKTGSAKDLVITEDLCDDCPKVVYIRLSQFGDSTNKDWLSVVNKLDLEVRNLLEEKKKVLGLVLDLRNNPGGYLSDAVFIASEFLRQGVIIVKQDNGQRIDMLRASRKGLFYDIPLVVLINKGSASASEIVSAALRDNKRSILVGETSFGKGTIQEAQDLGNGAGLHVTIGKWLTPEGTWVNNTGLTPDTTVSQDPKNPSRDIQLEKAVEGLVK